MCLLFPKKAFGLPKKFGRIIYENEHLKPNHLSSLPQKLPAAILWDTAAAVRLPRDLASSAVLTFSVQRLHAAPDRLHCGSPAPHHRCVGHRAVRLLGDSPNPPRKAKHFISKSCSKFDIWKFKRLVIDLKLLVLGAFTSVGKKFWKNRDTLLTVVFMIYDKIIWA